MRARPAVTRLITILSAGACLVGHPTSSHGEPLEEVVRAALRNYPAIVAAQYNRLSAQYDTERTRAQHFPSVDLQSGRRISGLAVDLTQPHMRVNLWAFGGIEAQVERDSWRERSLASQEAVTRDVVAYEVAGAWIRVLRAIRLIDALDRNLKRHQGLVDDFAEIARIDPGRRADLVQARSRFEQVRLAIAAEQAELRSAKQTLARFYPERFEEASVSFPPAPPEPRDIGTPAVVATHPAVQAAQRSVFSAESNVKAAKAARLPRVDVDAYAGKQSQSLLTVSFPGFDLGLAAAEKSAVAALSSARATLQEQERIVTESQRIALSDLASAQQRLDVAQGQVRISSDLVENYRAQFQIGRRNLLDLLNAFVELSAAEQALETARVDEVLARVEIDYSMGRLAARFEAPMETQP
jgi:outer membrane protein, adhesin transport system